MATKMVKDLRRGDSTPTSRGRRCRHSELLPFPHPRERPGAWKIEYEADGERGTAIQAGNDEAILADPLKKTNLMLSAIF